MIKFTKMQGLGNDYVYIDCTKNELSEDIPTLARKMSDRHFGIGSDGLILICRSDVADFKMRMFNFDGSEAEMCGNGIRCVGKFVYDKGLTTKKEIKIETLAGIKILQLNVEDKKVKTVRVDMGEPILEPKKIPVDSKENKIEIHALDKKFLCTCISMGNPHTITEIEDTKNFEIEKYGPIMEVDKHFPNKSNIEYIKIVDRKHILMRVWERGAGETLACGTGACAVGVASFLNGKTSNEVEVQLLGGNLQIDWNQNNNHVYMTGPAKIVFEGTWE